MQFLPYFRYMCVAHSYHSATELNSHWKWKFKFNFQCTHSLVMNPSKFSSQLQTGELLSRSLVDSWKIDMALCILDVSIVELTIIWTGGDTKATDSVCVCVCVCVCVGVCSYDLHTPSVLDRSSGVNTLLKRNCSIYLQREKERERRGGEGAESKCVCCSPREVPICSSQLRL